MEAKQNIDETMLMGQPQQPDLHQHNKEAPKCVGLACDASSLLGAEPPTPLTVDNSLGSASEPKLVELSYLTNKVDRMLQYENKSSATGQAAAVADTAEAANPTAAIAAPGPTKSHKSASICSQSSSTGSSANLLASSYSSCSSSSSSAAIGAELPMNQSASRGISQHANSSNCAEQPQDNYGASCDNDNDNDAAATAMRELLPMGCATACEPRTVKGTAADTEQSLEPRHEGASQSLEEPALEFAQQQRRASCSSPPPPATRLERSNSCSQATTAATISAAGSASLDSTATSGAPNSKLSTTSSCISIIGATAAADQSASSCSDSSHLLLGSSLRDELPAHRGGACSGDNNASVAGSESGVPISSSRLSLNAAPQGNGASRFFSSKLNTGSLWSLLSAGGLNTSNTAINESSVSSGAAERRAADESLGGEEAQLESSGSTSSFFTRQFLSFSKRPVVQTSSGHADGDESMARERQQTGPNATTVAAEASEQKKFEQQPAIKKRHRYNIKYIGNTLLHKNFTLPMLEWVVKDVKRQTVRGAQNLNQRQFSIPARDIVFEIQNNQLMASSCKDGHCIFVHPMHCVSKYAQLQHDPTCFAYIIRDSKDSPSFCHVFQAKGTARVHEIFSAVREATTSRAAGNTTDQQQQQQQLQSSGLSTSSLSSAARGLQKSASTEGHWRSLLGPNEPVVPTIVAPAAGGALAATVAADVQQVVHHPSVTNHHKHEQPRVTSAQAAGQATQADQLAASVQFENSYQFEVMFVKRVKLQVRRVPASFVDDALETLKSFEVSKTQIAKSVVSKRIINASVDERQEYDEHLESSARTSMSATQQQQHHLHTAQQVSSVSGVDSLDITQRRGSSVSLNPAAPSASGEQRESKSCQQSPAKSVVRLSSGDASKSPATVGAIGEQPDQATGDTGLGQTTNESEMKKHQSLDCLRTAALDYSAIQSVVKSGGAQQAPAYANDFSPYNTITSSDLNERIAAIPVVSGSSVSLDHETRQKLARQVRETIMATAANIKKGVYASGDKLDSSSSCKALDSLSCNVVSAVPAIDQIDAEPAETMLVEAPDEPQESSRETEKCGDSEHSGPRRSSACATSTLMSASSGTSGTANNFDLFRRASARQVVKNRTMLLLIGKDELCAISIDKHQMLFSKSFNSIVHCLQGINNRDHFGLICRDSGKINPQAESYAGFVFKCQSEKVVREIMAALRQVIYNSHHSYHAQDSPYNPLNSMLYAGSFGKPSQANLSPKLERLARPQTRAPTASDVPPSKSIPTPVVPPASSGLVSLAAKRGFIAGQLGVSESNAPRKPLDMAAPPPPSAPVGSSTSSMGFLGAGVIQASAHQQQQQQTFGAPKSNPIKSMFCDNCPLYWFHRLCCDIESLSAEASKAIILRRIESSLGEKDQDEVYSRFSEFKIDSIEQHNEIFMSLLRQQCERKQLRHNQLQTHQAALAKQLAVNSLAQQQRRSTSMQRDTCAPSVHVLESGSVRGPLLVSTSNGPVMTAVSLAAAATTTVPSSSNSRSGHQRSGSSSGSLVHLLQQPGATVVNSTVADASSAAIDNLKRAKNSISVSIENMLKRRGSGRDDETTDQSSSLAPISRAGSFKGRPTSSTEVVRTGEALSTADGQLTFQQQQSALNGLKRSQSSTDQGPQLQQQQSVAANWRDSILSRTFQATEVDLTTPLVGFFRRRGSLASNKGDASESESNARLDSKRASNDSLAGASIEPHSTNMTGQVSPLAGRTTTAQGSSAPAPQMLSSSFWKKNIFDKIHQPSSSTPNQQQQQQQSSQVQTTVVRKRSKAELRLLWQKAVRDQITLIKMDKQNQVLLKRNHKDGQQAPRDKTSSPQVVACNCNEPAIKSEPIDSIKLNYRDVPHGREASPQWSKLLKQDPSKKVEFVQVARLVRLGVPKRLRGEIWMFLMNQYQLRHGTGFQPADSEYRGDANQTYRSLLSQLSTQQHEIFVDIGRTFPTHPYYSQYLSIGQLSLFNLLKAYSLLDREVGYCQGLSFVAGTLLLHVDSEDEAFELMRHLLFNFGLRKQYLPSMNALHLQLYQMTRLLRDHEYDIFDHFDRSDISPSLYAAPWFLTLFASQFPLGFVSRLLDLIFLIGIEAIFRVSLTLLTYHKQALLECSSLESTMDFLRNDLVKIDDNDLARIFDNSIALDLRNKLIEYEIEYSFYCAEDRTRNMTTNEPRAIGVHSSRGQARGSKATTITNEKPKDADPTIAIDSNADSQWQGQQPDKPTIQQQDKNELIGSEVADATATVIIQHLLANNHLKSLRTNYSY